MGWSTRELAEMAGTTIKTVRYYHQAGLLEEPERRANGYKSYGPEHLARLLHVLRMREMGFPVSRILEITRSDSAEAATRRLLNEVEASIRRLEGIRDDLLASLGSEGHWKVPQGFAGVSEHLGRADRVLSLMMSRHFTGEAMEALRSISAAPDPVDAEFARLPADAGAAAIADLAARMAPVIARARTHHPLPDRAVQGGRAAEQRAARSMGKALAEFYNPAQVAVLVRAVELGGA
ncbi:MerR family transcriptional regulator [Nocardiopsis coralliicola]